MTKQATYDATDFFLLTTSDDQLPEARLLAAVVQRAIQDYASPKSEQKHQWRAARWLFSSDGEQTVMSLRWIAHYLSERPDYFRAAVLSRARTMKAQGLGASMMLMRVGR